MVSQVEITLKEQSRGFHLITDEIMKNLSVLPSEGILNLFIKHTSAALTINENSDQAVRYDLENIFNQLIKEKEPYYTHIFEGADDMPSHAKSIITGMSLNIPITKRKLNLGVWQGIYLCEFRNYGGRRKVVATILS